MYYTYILYCRKKRKLYCGSTNNLRRRIKEHQQNDAPYSFTRNEDIELIYYEAYRYDKDARAREKYYKTGWGRNHIKNILKSYLSNQDKSKNLGGK